MEAKKSGELPYWLRFSVAISSILTLLGLFFLYSQIQQTNDHFKLQNTSWLAIDYMPELTDNIVRFSIECENVGNFPLQMRIDSFIVRYRERVNPMKIHNDFGLSVYPSEKAKFHVADIWLTPTSLAEVKNGARFYVYLKVSYCDFDNPKELKKINRNIQLIYNEKTKSFSALTFRNEDYVGKWRHIL
ncbi:MAG: hypothetical protein V4663_14565 [Bacteroidota bacterium]